MKYEPGDKIIVLHTDEEGKVLEIINEQMVMIEVKGVKFPAYLDQIDYPYFKMFTEKRKADKKKIFIDNVKQEKVNIKTKTGEDKGVFISFLPVFDKDIFDDDVVEKFKIHLFNQTNTQFNFKYTLYFNGENNFEHINTILPQQDFYLHDVLFDDISDNPRFNFEFSLAAPDKKKAPYYEASLKLKGKQLFKRIEELQQKNEAAFSYLLFDKYPDKVEEEKVDLGKLGSAGFRVYDAGRIREHMPAARSVVDVHIEKITDSWKHLSNFEILSLQLKEFEKFYDLAVAHYQPTLTVIHGVGEGKLKDEIHAILRSKKEVKSFINQYTAAYGYGATEIYFSY
ncbi:MAG: Smr/MutS family protein [Bacteroidota bacterium]